MKKFILVVLAIGMTAGPAFALSWSWDMSVTGGYTASGNTVVGDELFFPLDVTTSGGSTVVQSLLGGADDSILDDFDTFTDFGSVTVLSTNTQFFPPNEENIDFEYTGGLDAKAYIVFEGLAGYIFDHDDGGTPTTDAASIVDDTFKLQFTPGAGSISFYLDTNTDPTDGPALKLAELTLLQGYGTSPIPIVGVPEGNFGIIAGFTSVLDDFWFLEDGTEFGDWMDKYGIPSIFASSFNLGATAVNIFDGDNGDIVLQVVNEGSFVITAVPEPSTIILLGAGLLGLGFIARRKKS